MKIWKFELKFDKTQVLRIPKSHKIMDIQIQSGKPVLWALVDPNSAGIDIKINMYVTGGETHEGILKKYEYLATVQDGTFVGHFFINRNI